MNKIPNPTDEHNQNDKPIFPPNQPLNTKNKDKKVINIPGWVMMALYCILISGGYLYHDYTLKKNNKAYKAVIASIQASVTEKTAEVETLIEKVNSLIEYKEKANDLLISEDILIEIDPRVANWAYKNAAPFIPLNMVIDIVKEASKYENYLLLLSVIKEESNFYVFARSDKGAKGLGQINTQKWKEELIGKGIWQEEIDVFDYKRNIAATNYIIEQHYKAAGSWREAFLKYNNSTEKYVDTVLGNYAELNLLLTRGKK